MPPGQRVLFLASAQVSTRQRILPISDLLPFLVNRTRPRFSSTPVFPSQVLVRHCEGVERWGWVALLRGAVHRPLFRSDPY